jgi:serine/threonine protein kinase
MTSLSQDLLTQYQREFADNHELDPETFLANQSDASAIDSLPALILLDIQLRLEQGLPVRLEERLQGFKKAMKKAADVAATLAYTRSVNPAEEATVAMGEATQAPLVKKTLPLPDATERLPEILGDQRFEPLELLGQGSFGSVYLARDKELHRLVACKISHEANSPEQGFIHEARVMAGLDHPNIVPVHDVFRTVDGRVAIISKYIAGSTLRETMDLRRLGFSQVARMLADVADALHYAHLHGVFHRDIKPGNILLDEQGKPFVSDFGLALKLNTPDGIPRLAGTPSYMSPEQARGDGNLVDGRSDIYSLGVVMYEMLTGSLPFSGCGPELLERIIRQEVMPPRSLDKQIPLALEKVCVQAMAKHISDRFATALDLANALKACCTYTPEPFDLSNVQLPPALVELQEELAKNVHDVWARQRINEGWEYGNYRDDMRKIHPDLVPYEQLSEGEKDYDRKTAEGTLKTILKLGFQIHPPK